MRTGKRHVFPGQSVSMMAVVVTPLELDRLGLHPRSASHYLWGVGWVTLPLCALCFRSLMCTKGLRTVPTSRGSDQDRDKEWREKSKEYNVWACGKQLIYAWHTAHIQ